MNLGAVILAGGHGRRMGSIDKSALTLDGVSFLDRIAGELSGSGELYLSVDQAERFPGCALPMVEDIFTQGGPMAGLHAALCACKSDALMAVGCDMPLFGRGLTEYLAAFWHDGLDAVVARTRDGRIHPLCGIYHKRAAAVLEELLESGERRMMLALERLRVKYVPLAHSAYPDRMLSNVNTPKDLMRARWGDVPLIGICGVKNSGKTTFLEHIIPRLREQGLQVGVLKHDGHDFSPDVPGTDSHRLMQAGANRAAVYSGYRYMLTGTWETAAPKELLPAFAGLDLILLEGGKHLGCPKIEIVRKAVSDRPVANPEHLLAVCTDADLPPDNVPVLGLEDVKGAVDLIVSYLSRETDRQEP